MWQIELDKYFDVLYCVDVCFKYFSLLKYISPALWRWRLHWQLRLRLLRRRLASSGSDAASTRLFLLLALGRRLLSILFILFGVLVCYFPLIVALWLFVIFILCCFLCYLFGLLFVLFLLPCVNDCPLVRLRDNRRGSLCFHLFFLVLQWQLWHFWNYRHLWSYG
jgi:hypothetical protein